MGAFLRPRVRRLAPWVLLPGLLASCVLYGSTVRISGTFSVNPGGLVTIQTGGPGLEVVATNQGDSPLLLQWRETFWGSTRELPLGPGEERVIPAPHRIRFEVTNPGDTHTTLLWNTRDRADPDAEESASG